MHRSRAYPRRVLDGYTLIEVLVVMGIIVLAIALAIPAIRSLTGSKSQQAAQNTIAAYIAASRADAIGVQDIEGVVFYIDPATDRVNCQHVAQSYDPLATTSVDVSGVVYLDLVADVHAGKSSDPLALPPGIRLTTFKDAPPPTSTPPPYADPFAASRYLGFNLYQPATKGQQGVALIGGVILFDGRGRLYTGRYGFRFLTHLPAGTVVGTALGTLVFGTTVPAKNWPMSSDASINEYLASQIAFTLFDRETFQNQRDASGNPFLISNQGSGTFSGLDQNPADGQNAGQQVPWLDVNSTAIFVNRYNGTLTRAE